MRRLHLSLILCLGLLLMVSGNTCLQAATSKSWNSANVRRLVNERRFNEAHRELLKALNSGSNEAHFELARTLLVQFKWARKIINRESVRTSQDKAAYKRENPYSVFVRTGAGYKLKDFHPYMPGDLANTVTIAWMQADYLPLVTGELKLYLAKAPRQSKNSKIAKEWFSALSLIAGPSYDPCFDRARLVTTINERLIKLAKLCGLVDNKTLNIDKLGAHPGS